MAQRVVFLFSEKVVFDKGTFTISQVVVFISIFVFSFLNNNFVLIRDTSDCLYSIND